MDQNALDDFQPGIVAGGLLLETGVDGLYGRGATFEHVVTGLLRVVHHAARHDGAERLRFPPVMNRAHLERNGYFSAFPQLAGCVHCFMGDEADHRRLVGRMVCDEDTSDEFRPSAVVLVPAACYPLYPALSARGVVPEAGVLADVASYCFRHEPSRDLARQQSFRMQEYVRVGRPDQVMEFRAQWLERARSICVALRLEGELALANDPFFGQGGERLAEQQRDSELKFEMLLPAGPGGAPRACMSFNAHQDHFGALWDLRMADGSTAHTACVGFGLERLALAMFHRHGTDIDAWPSAVREALNGTGRDRQDHVGGA